MIRTLVLGGALALVLGGLARADGFPPGQGPRYERLRPHGVHHHRRVHHVRRHGPARHGYGRPSYLEIAPGHLTHSLNAPIHNVPPRRFP